MTKYYYFGNQRVAMRKPDGAVNWLHGDHLGSTSLATDGDGGEVSWQLYFPFGEVRWANAEMPTDFGYTGQRLDGTGLMFYHARYYAPSLGRFISADSIVPSPGNPQDFNRYAYVRNNPLKFVDPTGHLCEYVDGRFVCSADPIPIGASQTTQQTLVVDEENPGSGCRTQAECQAGVRKMRNLLLVLFGISATAPVAVSLVPTVGSAEVIAAEVTTAACADGDCTNEVSAATDAVGQTIELLSADGNPLNEIEQVKAQIDLALGRQDYNLAGFAKKVGGEFFKNWRKLGLFDEGVQGWGQAFKQALSRTSGKIYFNLDGLDIPKALAGDPNVWVGRYTAWELQQIVNSPSWFSRTKFYLDGQELTMAQLAELGIQVVR